MAGRFFTVLATREAHLEIYIGIKNVYRYITDSLLESRDWHNIVNQLYFSFKNSNDKKINKAIDREEKEKYIL